MILRIRNMESDRCKTLVMEELNKLGLSYVSVELGEADIKENLSEGKLMLLDNSLRMAGLELMLNTREQIIKKIKEAVKQLVFFSDDLLRPNISKYIGERVNYDYNYLSKIFSESEGMTIEKYLIKQRIERAKKMLVFDKCSLSEIAYKLLFSSVAHLSNQFKKVTGTTPMVFRQLRVNRCSKTAEA